MRVPKYAAQAAVAMGFSRNIRALAICGQCGQVNPWSPKMSSKFWAFYRTMWNRLVFLVAMAMLGVAHGKRGADLSVWPKPQSMKCDAATQTLPPGATLVLNISIANSNYAEGPAELTELFNGQIVDAIFEHKTAAASAAPIPVAVAIATYEQALALETDESYTLEFDHLYKGAPSLPLTLSPLGRLTGVVTERDRLPNHRKDPARCDSRF